MVKIKTRNIIYFICLLFFFISCDNFKDEELMLERQDYTGNELEIDGYYYEQWASDDSPIENYTNVLFLYRNGIIIRSASFKTIDLNEVEKEMVEQYEYLQTHKTRHGVFIINENTIQLSMWVWNNKVRSFKSIGIIDNDTTFRIIKDIKSDGKEFECNDVYHFRQFSPKPDSTNNFIK